MAMLPRGRPRSPVRFFIDVIFLCVDSMAETGSHCLCGRFFSRRAERRVIEPEAVEFLSGFYDLDISRLEKILGRESPWKAGA